MEMARELRETGTIEYQVRYEYFLCKDVKGKTCDPIKCVETFDYYEDAKRFMNNLRDQWENRQLGHNASAELVRVVKTEEIMTWFS